MTGDVLSMRRTELQASPALALDLFRRCSVAQLVVEGPHCRPMHPVVLDGQVFVHSARRGEKTTWTGRSALLCAHEVVAEIPSYLRHPERACPATTFYRSAEIRGPLVEIRDPEHKLAVMKQLLRRYQPEGGYRELSLEDPLYSGAIGGLSVFAVEGEPVGRAKLGQWLEDSARHRIAEGLWMRGSPGDDRAIEAIGAAAPPGSAPPPFLRGPGETRLIPRIPDCRVDEAVALVAKEYWNKTWSEAEIGAAMRGSEVWVGAELGGSLVATARAMTDGTKLAYVGDVGVHPELRGRGVGSALMKLLIDHPRIRRARWVSLRTQGAERFYQELGFEMASHPPGRSELVMERRSAGSTARRRADCTR